ncbi:MULTISPECIES: type VI secretion system protein TssL, long form [unclassified Azospirillum]|uniref:type VI secretion system protein TssL, long form n=1 Tax=unclassified Azospirillum TaxID=2630922 RepID=UPI000B763EA2|nr:MULTISPECIES: type VI secretion system protein TssL, long form [unclassified Azospirillum]SNS92239.1 type VI secretion system protein ImpK [Azospirillum sp. RU38E]SNT09192.1 type VI secretion system protein ImpK [Azospirillum sp. RU37A]
MTGDNRRPTDRTVIRPTPGGWPTGGSAANAQHPPAASPAWGSGPFTATPPVAVSRNPLLAAASDLLAFINHVRELRTAPDVQRLREQTEQIVQAFQKQLKHVQLPADMVDTADYAACITVDDIVMNTPWGRQSNWSQQSIVSKRHKETFGGARFYEDLQRLKQEPGRNALLLELMYVCLSLGFQGPLRMQSSGLVDIARLREDLFQLIRPHGQTGGDLSPHWRGASEAVRQAASSVPAVATVFIALAVMVSLFLGLRLSLGAQTDTLLDRLAAAPGHERTFINRPPPPPLLPPPDGTSVKISRFLEAEIRERLVTVTESVGQITIRLHDAGLFASGSDRMEGRFQPVLERVAAALEEEPGRIVVVGHTDDVPISTARFRSNWELSRARAGTVRDLLSSRLSVPARLSAEGQADTNPLVPNTSPANRERNRRIDIILITGGAG